MTSAEHLVIGSGAGGAVTAALLAEAGRDVLVLEEGPLVQPDAVEHLSLEQMRRQYRHGGVSAALGRPPVAYVEGRCVGGGTEVNSGLYHVASEETLARWSRDWGVRDLDPDSLAPFAEATRSALSVQPLPGPAPRASQVLADGARALGWQAREIPRWYRYEGRPQRQTMLRTFLPRALDAGARLQPDTRVHRLVLRDGRVAGAMTDRGLVTAEHVWLCAGAIGSATLLLRAGVRRGVGRLSLHPTVKLAARFDAPLDGASDVAVHQVRPPRDRVSFGGSVSRPGHLAVMLADDWAGNRPAMEHADRTGVYYAAIRPFGRGRVTVLPGARDPLVTFGLTRADLELLGAGLGDLARLLVAAGAQAIHPGVRDGGTVARPEDVPALVTRGRASVMTVHLFSTAPIGEDPARSPVDSYGNVRGVRNLRVNDAALLPDAPGVNPQGTVMALAARNVARHLAT